MTMSNTCNNIENLIVYKDQKSLFDLGDEYIIPLYQRPYAWKYKEILQLIEDIEDVDEKQNYYIGSLIVARQNDFFEVIDGQQRLTTLFILLNVLGCKTTKSLSFACREKSNYTLHNIEQILSENKDLIDYEKIQSNIENGINIIKTELKKRTEQELTSFMNKLKSVILYRIEVPEHTDLNRYFEIMNTRGEQLEQHDILKASLMSNLGDNPKAQDIFSTIWEACSDMDGYVQMHFENTETSRLRDELFNLDWNQIPPETWSKYENLGRIQKKSAVAPTINNIIQKDFKIIEKESVIRNNKKIKIQYQSIIEFPVFLLHCLKCFVSRYKVEGNNIIYEQLDDKKLVLSFNRVIEHGLINGNPINPEDFSKKFIILLLRTRFLFDKYIIKRVYDDVNVDGEWSLDELKKTGNTPSYSRTKFMDYKEWYQNDKGKLHRSKEVLMLQSALRVSYTSPKTMHWITTLLKALLLDKDERAYMSNFNKKIEKIAKEAVISNFFNKCKNDSYELGVNTPHIVFNYLDYLLWKADYDSNKNKYKDFVFEFRNSVEHWYPQNPSGGTFDPWINGKDTFGNLCLLQRNVNSQFSNLAPESKKSTYIERIEKGSLKLRIMSDLTVAKNGKIASYYWKDEACKLHEEEMINILKSACGI